MGYRSLLIFRWGNMLLLCIRSDVMPQTVAGALSGTSLEDTGGMRLNHFPDRKMKGNDRGAFNLRALRKERARHATGGKAAAGRPS